MPGSLYPVVPLNEATKIAVVIAQKGAGQPMRRLDVFEELGKSPDSGPSRTLVTASSGYGLTKGSYQAEFLELTELGRRLAVENDRTALIDAMMSVNLFKRYLETYKGGQVPADVAAKSHLAQGGVPIDRTEACLAILMAGAEEAKLIATMSGAKRVLSRDHAVEQLVGKGGAALKGSPPPEKPEDKPPVKNGAALKSIPSLNISLEIHLPNDQSPEVYDAIFASMRKHLIDAE